MNIDAYKLLFLILTAVLILVVLKGFKSSIASILSIAVCCIVMAYVIRELTPAVELINTLSEKAGISSSYLKIILKCIGICLLGDFTSHLCKDIGDSTLAFNAELVSKVSIIITSLPMYIDIFNLVLTLWEN